MTFMIIDSTGNAIEAFEDVAQGREVLRAIVTNDPTAARELALIAFDDDGNAVGDPEIAADLGVAPEAAHQMTLADGIFSWFQVNAETFTALWPAGARMAQVPALNQQAATL